MTASASGTMAKLVLCSMCCVSESLVLTTSVAGVASSNLSTSLQQQRGIAQRHYSEGRFLDPEPDMESHVHPSELAMTGQQKPHIVVIVADDLGFSDVGWRRDDIKTPHLDALRRQGVDMEQWHGHSICTPSRASLLTGKYAFHTGLQHSYILPGGPTALPLNFRTSANFLKAAGYSTHLIGKWHLGFRSWAHTPLERGFDTFFGYLGGSEDYYTHKCKGSLDLRDMCGASNQSGSYSTKLFNTHAKNIIRQHNQSKPMFLYLAYQSVHSPREAPPGINIEVDFGHIQDKDRRLMASMIQALDTAVGDVVQELHNSMMWSNTLLFFLSDNGGPTFKGNSNWPLRGGKSTMWEGGHRVPAFVVHGTQETLGMPRKFEALAHHIDLLPTMLAAAGVENIADFGFDGTNLWPYLTGGKSEDELMSRHLVLNINTVNSPDGINDPTDWSGFAGVKTLQWKLVLGFPGTPNGVCWPPGQGIMSSELRNSCAEATSLPQDLDQPHLYNLTGDPSETHDVAIEHPAIVQDMFEVMQPYFDTAVVPLNMFRSQRQAPLQALTAAQIAGAWSPWEQCMKCQCSDEVPNLAQKQFLNGGVDKQAMVTAPWLTAAHKSRRGELGE